MKQIKIILFEIILICISLSICSKNSSKDIIFNWKNNNYLWLVADSTYERYFPSLSEVKYAKELSINYIDSIKKENKGINLIPYPHRTYYRQYIGYIDKNGNKIIFINAFCKFNRRNSLRSNCIYILDGGACYYHIYVNLIKNKCFSFTLNGSE